LITFLYPFFCPPRKGKRGQNQFISLAIDVLFTVGIYWLMQWYKVNILFFLFLVFKNENKSIFKYFTKFKTKMVIFDVLIKWNWLRTTFWEIQELARDEGKILMLSFIMLLRNYNNQCFMVNKYLNVNFRGFYHYCIKFEARKKVSLY
jgi:hypothetical protein